MRVVAVEEFGGPEGLVLRDAPDPEPAAGQVLITTEAAGLGGVDVVIRRGGLGTLGFAAGHVLGSEVAGTVSAVGAGVDAGWVGRRVWGFTGLGGGYAEQAVVDLEDLTELPAGLSSVAAVALGSAAPVAHFALAHGHFAPGETVLVRGAAGSIGIAAVELAARGGAAAIAVTTSSAARGDRLRELGATHVLDRSGGGDLPVSDGFDVILDVVGGPDTPEFLDRLAPNGRMVAVGAVAGWPSADFGTRLLEGFRRSRTFATFSLDTVPIARKNSVRAEQFDAAVRGELHAVVHEVLPLARAADGHRAMDAGTVFGRIVLVP